MSQIPPPLSQIPPLLALAAPPKRSAAPDAQASARSAQKHPEADSRAAKAPPTRPVIPETNAQKFRALVAWLHYPEEACAVQLGISRTLLRGILAETSIPPVETQDRIFVWSRRWPHGLILQTNWPIPAKDHRVKVKE